MKPLVVVVVLALIMGVGIYIGMSGLVTQYAFVPGRSSAGTAVCTPDSAFVQRGAAVRFISSQLPAGALYHWASDEGRSEMSTNGTFSVQFSTAGAKTVSLFYFDRNAWLRSTCQVQVR
ncbi:MAG: hypothetical protein AAB375_02935 [Patescibacteria group bacterium]